MAVVRKEDAGFREKGDLGKDGEIKRATDKRVPIRQYTAAERT